jgi:hypothetical protein
LLRDGTAVSILILSFTAIMLTAFPPVSRAYRDPRKAETIIRRHVRAIGGLERIRALRSIRAAGHVSVLGHEAPFTLWMERPNHVRFELSLRGRQIVQAYDGKTAWWVNPLVGSMEPQVMPEDMASIVTQWADFEGPLVGYRKKGHRVDYRGLVDLPSGKQAYRLDVRLVSGGVWEIYIDPASYLEVQRVCDQRVGDGTTRVATYFDRYTTVGGVRVPAVIHGQGIEGVEYVLSFTAYKTNVPIDPMKFRMPARTGSLRGAPSSVALSRPHAHRRNPVAPCSF